jgi:NTP pyrophosphatase (non-canonical NTP hydrolase)
MELGELARRIDAISARYAQIYGFERDGDWLMLKVQEEVGELAQAWLAKTGRQRDKGLSPAEIEERFALELADSIGMLLALAHHTGVDVERAMDAKWLVWDRRTNQRDEDLDDAERALEGRALRGEAGDAAPGEGAERRAE